MIIDCISDLHGAFPELEGGDLLMVGGDCTSNDSLISWTCFVKWLDNQNYRKKIVIAGNHDNVLKTNGWFFVEYITDIVYLFDSVTEFEGLKIWGSPWTKTFEGMNPDCKAFTVDTDEELAKKWELIPEDTDILITHCPPYGILDKTKLNEFVGSESLAYEIGSRKNPPKLWVWGHVHEAYGKDLAVRGKPVIMVNASIMNEDYKPVNKPIRVIL